MTLGKLSLNELTFSPFPLVSTSLLLFQGVDPFLPKYALRLRYRQHEQMNIL